MDDGSINPELAGLVARTGEPIETPADQALAEACLEDAWNWVRLYGKPEWGYLEPGTPGIARTVAVSAAARCYQNPSGFISERGDSVTFERYDDFAKGAEPTQQEIAAIRRAGNQGGRITSLSIVNPDMLRTRTPRRRNSLSVRYTGVGDPNRRPVPIAGWW